MPESKSGWLLSVLLVLLFDFVHSELLPEKNMLESSTNCSLRYLQMRVKLENCLPVRLVTRACSGACVSYTRVSLEHPELLQTKCDCCQYVGRRKKRFGIKCPQKNARNRYTIKVMSVTMPRRCLCRPCSNVANGVESAEKVMFRTSPILGAMVTADIIR
ncbi:bursicon-like [Dreissena polymorpha]|uniref:DAN domain-containing protein n=1 Tax=Dreissena polymorpha TaxID=45954 RepID=A0A9D4NGF5_DREPO|nr:bursicon-like [Dreissena polymorpha]KAH3893831.1 hypothetical protein DPMN_017983 [Dreissena polymorpha]